MSKCLEDFISGCKRATGAAAAICLLSPISCLAAGDARYSQMPAPREFDQTINRALEMSDSISSRDFMPDFNSPQGQQIMEFAKQLKAASQGKLKYLTDSGLDPMSSSVFDNKASIEQYIAEQKAKEKRQRQKEELAEQHGRFTNLIFISMSLDELTLRQIYEQNAGDPNTALVFRGLPPGTENIGDAVRVFQKMAEDWGLLKTGKLPNVLLNPVWFEEYGIDKVPAMVMLSERTQTRSGDPRTGEAVKVPKEISRVYGLIEPQWLKERFAAGKSGDFGIRGPVAEIAEKDLIEEMKERMAAIDWESRKREAVKHVWQNQPIEELPKAEKRSTIMFDPTIEITEDIIVDDPRNPGRKLEIARKGQRVNPLEQIAFPRLLVVFDARERDEELLVKTKLDEWLERTKVAPVNVRIMLSGIDRDKGWDEYNRLTEELGYPVFVLMPEVRESFRIRHHPSIVYADNLKKEFVVEEFGPFEPRPDKTAKGDR